MRWAKSSGGGLRRLTRLELSGTQLIGVPAMTAIVTRLRATPCVLVLSDLVLCGLPKLKYATNEVTAVYDELSQLLGAKFKCPRPLPVPEGGLPPPPEMIPMDPSAYGGGYGSGGDY